MDLPIPIKVWFSGPLVAVWSWPVQSSVAWNIFWLSVGWMWMWPKAVLRVVTWWAVVCGLSVVWLVWCIMTGSVAVALVCWMGLPSATSIASMPIPLLWSGAATVQMTTATASMSAISKLWPELISSFSIFPVVSRVWPGVAVSACLVMLHWCVWRWYFVRDIHDYMSVFFAFMASDVRAVSYDVSWFLALKTLIIRLWHHVDHWRWKDGCCKLLWCIEFLYLSNDIL